MTQLFSNNAKATLSAAITDTDTVMTLQADEGDLFNAISSPDFELVDIKVGDSHEIVKVTGRTLGSDALTIERGQEGTTAAAAPADSETKGTVTAGSLGGLLQVDNGGDARGANSVNVQPSRLTTDQVAAGDNSIAIGRNSEAKNINNISIGVDSATNSLSSAAIAMGRSALCEKGAGIAIGQYSVSKGASSLALGGHARSYADGAVSIAGRAYNVAHSIVTAYAPSFHSPFRRASGTEYSVYGGLSGMIASEPMDLAGGLAWTASTGFAHGIAVQPPVPNGLQYLRYDYDFNIDNDPDLSSYTPSLTDVPEPIWPTANNGDVVDGNGDWVALKLDGDYIMQLPDDFMIEEVLFVAYKASGATVQANISIGTTGDLTKIINNQLTVALTADKAVTKWTLSHPVIVPDITVKIDTHATATQMYGQFFFKGFYVKQGSI